MKKLILIGTLITIAPISAAAEVCYLGYWSERDQACVSMNEIIAQTVESYGSGTPVQPYTDSTATYIRNYDNDDAADQR